MKSRLASSVVLGALVLTAATGCTFITSQATTIAYSASDGVNISAEAGPLDVRNTMVFTDETGELGNLVAGIVNPTKEDLTLKVQVEGQDKALEVEVPAGETVSLGANAEPLLLQGLQTLPGATVRIHFQSGDGGGVLEEVPVLDGALPYYSDLVPSDPPATAFPTTVPAPATPTPTEQPQG